MNKSAIHLSIIVSVFIILIIFNIDTTDESKKFSIEIFSTIISALIGGFVAFYAAKIQVDGHRNIETKREDRNCRNLIIILINDLTDFNKKLDTIISDENSLEETFEQLKSQNFSYEFVPIDPLSKFKEEFIYIIDNKDKLTLFLAIYNRLNLFKSSLVTPDIKKIRKLHSDINELIVFFDAMLEKTLTIK